MSTTPGDHLPLTKYSKDPSELHGHVLDGRFLIEQSLGKGAMGLVLGARELSTGRQVAVKLLNPSVVDMEVSQARFVREAQASRHVTHPNVIETIDFGTTDTGVHFMVMEYLRGADLYRFAKEKGALDPLAAGDIAVQICNALQAIHDAGFVHRDLKPENIWISDELGPNGYPLVKIIDFGIAGLVEEAESLKGEDGAGAGGGGGGIGKKLTKTGHTVGTVHYMAPEQAITSKVDGRADIYSMACMIWELVAGRCTFEATTQMQVMMKQLTEDPEPPSTVNPAVPPWFDVAVLKCMAKRPEERYQTAKQAGDVFKAGMAGSLREASGENWRDAATAAAPTSEALEMLKAQQQAAQAPEPQPTESAPAAKAEDPPTTEVRRPGQDNKSNQLALWLSIAALVAVVVIFLVTR